MPDRLNPAERLAFVLHEMFAFSFEEIGTIIGRSPAATRQLASRACRRVQKSIRMPISQQRELVEAFLRALRAGDFEGLLAVLDPNVVILIIGHGHVAGGLEALALLEAGQEFQLLITDILITPLTGFDLLLRAKQQFPNVAVAIASAGVATRELVRPLN